MAAAPPPAEFYQQQAPYDAHVSPRPAAAAAAVVEGGQYPGTVAQPPRSSPSAAGTISSPSAAGSGGGGGGGGGGGVGGFSGHAMAAPPQQPQQQQQQQQQGQYPAPPLLPPGASLHNGGILWNSSNIFANSYRVPGPGGRGYTYYDKSMPMPPVNAALGPPTLLQQWDQQTRLLKLFVILLVIFVLLQWTASWTVGLFMPLLFVPTYMLYRAWRRHFDQVELYMLLKLYATAFVPGALVVMLVESVITFVFLLVCFGSTLSSFLTPSTNPSDPSKGGDDGNDAPEGMEFLNFSVSPALIIFLFLLSYVSAGGVEESLKYYCTNSIKRLRPNYKVVTGYGLYAIASALGFSTMENIGYVLSGAFSKGGDTSALGVLLNVLGRTCISTPLHVLTGYLIGLQVIRRDILGEPLGITSVMGWSVFFHGTFDFGLFLIMVLQKSWSSGPDDNVVSYILMGCVVVNCYVGLAWRIWRSRQAIYNRVESPDEVVGVVVDEQDQQQPQGQEQNGGSGSGAGMQQASSIGANGFSRLQENERAEAVV